MNQVTTKQPTMTAILASNSIKSLGENLSLNTQQLATAKSNALRLSGDAKLAKCDPYSLVKFCFESARYNFTKDDCMYPVPYGDKVQAQMGYKGLIEIALRAGYKKVSAVEVKKCDKVTRDRETGEAIVSFNEDYDLSVKSETIGYYAYAIDSDGTKVSLYMSQEECLKHGKRYSKSFNNLWSTDTEKMCLKTVCKRLCSKLRQTPEMNSALKADQIVYGKENEKDAYLDNPLNDKNINAEMQKSTVTNKLVIDEEVVEKPAKEEVSFDDILDDNGEIKAEEETF